MPINDIDAKIQTMIVLISERLVNASALAKSAVTCSGEGNTASAVDIALDLEQPIYEATILLNAMSLLHRIARD